MGVKGEGWWGSGEGRGRVREEERIIRGCSNGKIDVIVLIIRKRVCMCRDLR